MSSPASTTSSSSTTSPSPSATNGDEGGGTVQHGANYFFGFLITFVGLLIIFIVFGILGSRRRLAARRDATLNGIRRFPNGMPEAPPQLYEYFFVVGEDKWSDIMPLSIRFWREEKEKDSNSVKHGLQALPPATPARRSTSCINDHTSSLIPLNRLPTHHQNPSLQTQTETDPDPPGIIEVAVMIAMPSRDLSTRADQPRSQDHLLEYQIGNVSLPWQLTS